MVIIVKKFSNNIFCAQRKTRKKIIIEKENMEDRDGKSMVKERSVICKEIERKFEIK